MAQRLLEPGELTGPSGKVEPIDELVLFDMNAPPALGLPRDESLDEIVRAYIEDYLDS